LIITFAFDVRGVGGEKNFSKRSIYVDRAVPKKGTALFFYAPPLQKYAILPLVGVDLHHFSGFSHAYLPAEAEIVAFRFMGNS
jgi:hypothetical protein